MLYPVVGTLLNERSFTDAVGRYEEQAAALPEKERQEMLAAAHAYNDSLRGDPVHDPFIPNSGWAQPEGYDDVLDVDGAGLMGVVEVPAIGVRLPIRHGTSDEVLAHGAGHIPQTLSLIHISFGPLRAHTPDRPGTSRSSAPRCRTSARACRRR